MIIRSGGGGIRFQSETKFLALSGLVGVDIQARKDLELPQVVGRETNQNDEVCYYYTKGQQIAYSFTLKMALCEVLHV